MGMEIERKFLIKNDSWRKFADMGTEYRQGYVKTDSFVTVRVRRQGDKAVLTLKSPVSPDGVSRHEYEYSIPVSDADEMLEILCSKPLIEKIRYVIKNGDLKWEIDEFKGDNEGLVLCEIELPSPDAVFDHPEWLGCEVTGDVRYYNSRLASHPYKFWKD